MAYFLWLLLRLLNSQDQTVPSFFAWKTKLRNIGICHAAIKKTVVTYLPPIDAKVTEFSTINQYLSYMQKLAEEANMPYVNVSLDVGAAMNAYKLIWNHPKKFGNVIIHLGDFHFIKENFGVIGKLVAGSGFEDVTFQAGLCSTGSLKGVLDGLVPGLLPFVCNLLCFINWILHLSCINVHAENQIGECAHRSKHVTRRTRGMAFCPTTALESRTTSKY